MNWLAYIPLYGSVILLLWLFNKMIRQEINKAKLNVCVRIGGFVGGATMLLSVLVLKLVNSYYDISDFFNNYGLLLVYLLTGYSTNLFFFTYVNRNWRKLQGYETDMPVGMLFRKMYCGQCGNELSKKKITSTHQAEDPEFTRRFPEHTTVGMNRIEKTRYMYVCPSCNATVTYEEQRLIAKKQKILKRKVINTK